MGSVSFKLIKKELRKSQMGCTNSKKAVKGNEKADDPNKKKSGEKSIQQRKVDSGQKSPQVKRSTPRKKDSNSQVGGTSRSS